MKPGEASAPEDVPVQMKHRLPRGRPDVDDHTVVVQSLACGGLGHKAQHAPCFLVRERVDLAEAVDVSGGEDEQMRRGSRSDVPDRDKPVGSMNVIAVGGQTAEETVVPSLSRQRRAPPRSSHSFRGLVRMPHRARR